MNLSLLEYLCDPYDKSDLTLVEPVFSSEEIVESGRLVSTGGRSYEIRNGVPRFIDGDSLSKSVDSFGAEWNHFNFDTFRDNWLNHTVANTFGSLEVFKGKVVVDCGAGSGMQAKWISQAGAKQVIALELSHAVDGIIQDNLKGLSNVDVVQCSIDLPPIKDNVIPGIVICHNVIQHTPSVENTAHALWRLVGDGGEFVFNCYKKNDQGLLRKVRLSIYYVLRSILSRLPFSAILFYSKLMATLRFIPVLGWILEKSLFMVRGEVSNGPDWLYRAWKAGALNTYDCYGSHAYQHLKSDDEIRQLVLELQPKSELVLNAEDYFRRPQPIGIGLRIYKGHI
jgi:ubiquinone/menaquinone biosynthesis C-methylase UbiE/uncharacterized protein YbaR (Trm112 family)